MYTVLILTCFLFIFNKYAYQHMILEILELYRQNFEEFLAVPIIKGKVSEQEKLAKGLYTATVEVFLPSSRWYIDTSGELFCSNIANAWGIRGANCLGEKAMGWVNSWSCSIRADRASYRDANSQEIFDDCVATMKTLRKAGIRASMDKKDYHTPEWKYSYPEMNGVPLRIET
ncbi:hypothetical protein Q3G72_022505 [Acer saccharum]|nr:hypothetical protein Q3G72_022505 [Acer saccharum]